MKNIPLSWLVHRRLSQEYLISPQTGSESDLFHRWRVILAWLPAVDQWELCQAFKSFVFVWMLLKTGTGSADSRTEYGERGTLSGERWTRNRKRGAGNDSLLFRPFFRVVVRHFKLLCGLPLYFRSQFLFLVSRSPFLILITSISCWPKFKLLFVFQCLYRCVITFYFIIYADIKWTVSELLD